MKPPLLLTEENGAPVLASPGAGRSLALSAVACPGALEDPAPAEAMARVEWYWARAAACAEDGGAALLLTGLPGLREARLALLGARQAGLPVYVLLEGKGACAEERLRAALVCLQALGAAGVLAAWDGAPEDAAALAERVLPWAKLPVGLVPAGGGVLTAAEARVWLEAGFAAAGPVAPGDVPGLADVLPVWKGRREEAALLLCSCRDVFHLEEDFTASEAISCSLDMSAAILEAEDRGADVLRFRVEHVEDAEHFARNAHMARDGVALWAGGPEALETALLCYCGRALVDARSDVAEEELRALARAYGAAVR